MTRGTDQHLMLGMEQVIWWAANHPMVGGKWPKTPRDGKGWEGPILGQTKPPPAARKAARELFEAFAEYEGKTLSEDVMGSTVAFGRSVALGALGIISPGFDSRGYEIKMDVELEADTLIWTITTCDDKTSEAPARANPGASPAWYRVIWYTPQGDRESGLYPHNYLDNFLRYLRSTGVDNIDVKQERRKT